MQGFAHGFALQLLGVTLVGVALGSAEALHLRRSGFDLGARGVAEIVLGHGVLGLLVGAIPAALVAALRASGRGERLGLRAGGLAERFVGTLPTLFTAFALFGLYVNIAWLPRRFDPLSLATDAGLGVGLLALGLLWSVRPWRGGGDAPTLGAVLVVLAALLVWAASPPASGSRDVSEARATPPPGAPNIILILLDTLRADHLGVYGYPRPTSPRIDALGHSGQVFERAYSTSNWTRPALASLHTSTLPARHQVTDLDRGVPRELDLLAEQLQRHGYQTGLVSVGANFEPSDGYDRGVDFFHTARTRVALARTVIFQYVVLKKFPWVRTLLAGDEGEGDPRDPDRLTENALEFVRGADPSRPIFLFVHYLGPHDPYAPPPPYDQIFGSDGVVQRLVKPPDDLWAGRDAFSDADRQQMIDQYDEEIVWHDENLGRFLDALRAAGRLDDAVVAITSDHGEGFGEHGVWGHNASLFEEVVRVPLLFWSSEPWNQPRRHRVPVSLMDVAPTLLDLAGAPPASTFDGDSLVPWLRGETSETARTVHMQNPPSGEVGLRSESYSYFEEDNLARKGRWLYRAEDVKQKEELTEREPALAEELSAAARLRHEYDYARRSDAPAVVLDEARLEQLKALGYIE